MLLLDKVSSRLTYLVHNIYSVYVPTTHEDMNPKPFDKHTLPLIQRQAPMQIRPPALPIIPNHMPLPPKLILIDRQSF